MKETIREGVKLSGVILQRKTNHERHLTQGEKSLRVGGRVWGWGNWVMGV